MSMTEPRILAKYEARIAELEACLGAGVLEDHASNHGTGNDV